MTPTRADHSKSARSLETPPRSRAQAIERGELIDITELAVRKRFIVPVALTAEVYADATDLSSTYLLSSDTADTRLENLLDYARGNVAENEHRSGFTFSFYMPIGNHTTYTADLQLTPGDDDGESVITISKSKEDRRPR